MLLRTLVTFTLAARCASSWSGCFDAYNRTCLTSWGVTAGTASFSLRCAPPAPKVRSIAWCAVGINSDNSSMVVAETFMLQVLSSGRVVVEDRANVAHAAPACMATQLSHLSYGEVDATGALVANWTRPARVPTGAAGQGYVDILDAPVYVIAAINAGARVDAACNVATIGGHQGAYSAPGQVNLFQQGPTARKLGGRGGERLRGDGEPFG